MRLLTPCDSVGVGWATADFTDDSFLGRAVPGLGGDNRRLPLVAFALPCLPASLPQTPSPSHPAVRCCYQREWRCTGRPGR